MSFKLTAQERKEKGAKVRTKTVLPAVLYGAGGKPVSLSLGYEEFSQLHKEAGESSLIDLAVGDKDEGKVLIQDIQYDPVTDRMNHVDLRRIDMNKPITARVELRFTGESPAIKELGGTLVRSLNEVEIKCLPKDLMSRIDVDISVLKTYDVSVKVRDLKITEGVEIVNPHAEDLVVKVMAPISEEELKAMETATAPADLAQIEVAGKKKEEEEGEAGAEAVPGEEQKDQKKEAPKKEEKK